MNGDFGELIDKLHSYQNELDILFQQYNENDSNIKMEILAMKMLVVFYNYTISCFEVLNDVNIDRIMHIARKTLTGISYGLATLTLFKAPNISLPSLLASYLLTIKNKRYDKQKFIITDEEANELLDLLDIFEDDYAMRIDSIFEKIDTFEDENYLNKLPDMERRKMIACNNLLRFLREEDNTLNLENNNEIDDYLLKVMNDSINIKCDDFFESLQLVENNYQALERKLVKLKKKDDHLTNNFKIIG